jgi:hypothetical protein
MYDHFVEEEPQNSAENLEVLKTVYKKDGPVHVYEMALLDKLIQGGLRKS